MSNPGVRQSIRLRMAKFTAPEADSQIVGQRMTLAKQLVYQALMLAVLAVLILPTVATLAPLFVLLNRIVIGDFNVRNSLFGVGLALLSSLLPFAIWNLKGYIDTIPKELEEAALIDGASPNQTF